MDDDARRAIRDPQPGIPGADAEVDVLDVHVVAGSKAPSSKKVSRRMIRQAPVTAAKSRGTSTAGSSAGSAAMDVIELALAVPDDPGVLDRPVGVEQAAAGDPDRRVGHRLDERREPARLRDRVVVQEHDELAAREARALVAGAAEALVLRVDHAASAAGSLLGAKESAVPSVEALSITITSWGVPVAVARIVSRHCLVSSRRLKTGITIETSG